jgi:hypothetical protein
LPLNNGVSEGYEKNIGDLPESRLRTKTQESARKCTLSGNTTATDFGGVAAESGAPGDNCPTSAIFGRQNSIVFTAGAFRSLSKPM